MNFERGKDPKEILEIGKSWDAPKIDSIVIQVKNPYIEDDRSFNEKRFTNGSFRKNPQIIFKDRIRGKEVHKILELLRDNKKFPWSYFFDKHPQLEGWIKDDENLFLIYLLLDRKHHGSSSGSGYAFLSLRDIVGKYVVYDGKVYYMKKDR